MSDWKNKDKEVKDSKETTKDEILALAVIASSLIRQGSTKSVVPREAFMILKDLKKCYQENLGSD